MRSGAQLAHPRVLPKLWVVGNKRRGGTRIRGGEKVSPRSRAGRPGPATGDLIPFGLMIATGKDLVRELQRRLGDDVKIACSVHRYEGQPHWHLAFDRKVPAYKAERAVDKALERRRDRTLERARALERDCAIGAALKRDANLIPDLTILEQRAREHEITRVIEGSWRPEMER